MPCASWKHPTTSGYPNAGRSRSWTQSRQRTPETRSSVRSRCVLPKHYSLERRKTDMGSSFTREDLDKWVQRWLDANRECEQKGDWKPLADFYTEDATYGWNIGPKEDVMCVGRDQIRDVALGLEMQGLENWVYEYQKVLVDEKQGEIVGFWKQIVNKSDGSQDE